MKQKGQRLAYLTRLNQLARPIQLPGGSRPMRVFGQFILISVLAAVSLPGVSTTAAQAPARDAATVLAQAREALGGEKRLSAIRNFVATGRTQQVRGDNLVPIEFEIAVELPDKYVRKDEIPAQESGPTSTGFNGEELIQLPVPVMPTPPPGMARAGGPAGAPAPAQLEAARKARVVAAKQDFVRLALGMFAGSFSSYPLTFTYVGEAEAPQGRADVVEGKAPNFSVRLFVNSQTHLPIMVSWQAPGRPAGPARGGPPSPSPGASAGQVPPSPAPGASAPGVTPPGAAAPGATPPGAAAPGGAAQPAQPLPPGAASPGASPGQAGPPPIVPSGESRQPPRLPPGVGDPPSNATPPPLPVPAARGAGTPGAPGPGAAQGRGAPATPVEFRIYYGDYRDVDGLQWPFRLRRATGSDTTEETIFDRFRINTKIDPKKFEVRK
jgi:hypothetical protein